MEEREHEEFEVTEVQIDTEEIAEYLYTALIDFGLAPTEEEVELIADLMFDFLLAKQLMDEADVEDYD
jgi:DNA-binding phage protein